MLNNLSATLKLRLVVLFLIATSALLAGIIFHFFNAADLTAFIPILTISVITICLLAYRIFVRAQNILAPQGKTQHAVELELLAAEIRQRAVLEHIVDGIITIDEVGTVQSFNRAAEAIFGYAADEVVGQNIKMLMPEPYTTEHDGYLQHYRDTGDAHVIGIGREVEGRRKDGSTFPLELAVSEMGIDGQRLFSGIVRDITERKEQERALLDAETRQRVVLENIVDGIITIDEVGTVQDFNRAAEVIFGYAADEVVGQNIKTLMPEPYTTEHDGYLQHYRDTGDAHVIGIGREVEGKRKDGSTFPLDLAVSEMKVDGQRLFSGIVRDITERRLAEQSLVEARNSAESSTRSKSEFLANMSHEIRTPMNAVINLAYLANNKKLPAKTQDYLFKIEESGRSLLGIINDILDFSKIEAGKLEIETASFDLHHLLNQLATVVGYRALEKNVEVLFSTDRDVPEHIMGDSLRLGQVLTNLVGNAIKFTEKGEVVLAVTVAKHEGDQYTLKFEVRDTGIGMTEEQVSRLFKSFSQADGSTSRKYGGTGLGLSISKQLIELMGGQITVESTLGVGSTFSFSICVAHSVEREYRSRTAYPDVSNIRVLVVDDNESARLIACDTLTGFGFKVNAVSSGEMAVKELSAVNVTSENAYQVVLLDWRMPGMDGLQTLKSIQQSDAITEQPKIILCTAYGIESVRDMGAGLNADVYLPKPFSNSSLLDAIGRCTGHSGLEKKEQGLDVEDSVLADIRKIKDANILLVDDNEINQMIGVDLLQNQNIKVRAVGSAVEAYKALEEENFDLILMDIQMPGIDGLEATRQLRKDSRFSKLPILAMTAHAMESDHERSLAAGMNDHLSKPIDPNKLYRALIKWITGNNHVKLINTNGADKGIKMLPDYLPGIDQDRGLSQLGGNAQLYHRLLVKFYEQYAAVDKQLEELIEKGEQEEAIRLVHSVKGVAGSLGAMKLFEIANQLERKFRARETDDAENRLEFNKALVEIMTGLAGLKNSG